MKILIVTLLTTISISTYANSSNIDEYYLLNGLKILVKENHHAPEVTIHIMYKIGSSYENNGITGISHALEHMMFRGTQNHKQGDLRKIISYQGGNHNAFTFADYTVYCTIISADHLSTIFDLESDRMQGLLLDKSLFEKEKSVIIEERKQTIEDNPKALLYERFKIAAYVSSPYRNPIIGSMYDIQNLDIEDLKGWYKKWYAPNNAVVIVVGNVYSVEVFKLAEQYFGKLFTINISEPMFQNETKFSGERKIIIEAPSKLPFLILGYNVPSLLTADYKWKAYALYIIQKIASTRLNKELVSEKQISVGIDVNYNLYSRLSNVFMLESTPIQGHTIEEIKIALLRHLEKLQTELVSQKELEHIKVQIATQQIYDEDSNRGQAYNIGKLEAIGLSWQENESHMKSIEAITVEQVQAVAQEYLTPDRVIVAELHPITLVDHKKPTPPMKEEL